MQTPHRSFLSLLVLSAVGWAGETSAASDPGSSLAWGDFDADGLADALAIAPDGAAALLRNRGDGTFEDRTADLLPIGEASLVSAAWGDLDGDGLADLLLVQRSGAAILFSNGGVDGFSDVTHAAGLGADVAGALSARWVDYDGDRLDDIVLFGAAGPRLFHNAGGFLTPAGTGALGSVPGALVAPFATTATPHGSASGAKGAASAATDRQAPGVNGPVGSGPGSSPSLAAAGGSVFTTGGTAVAAGVPYCAIGIDDAAGGGCIDASSNPSLGSLYPLSKPLFVSPDGYVGMGTTSPAAQLEVRGVDFVVPSAAIVEDDVVVAAPDSVLGLYSGSGGNWGSVLTLGEVSGGLVDKWSIARLTSGAGSDLRFTYGADPSYAANPGLFTMDSTGAFGIGTTSPSFPLHVVNDNGDNGFTAFIDASDAGPGAALSVLPGSDNWGSFIGGSARFGYWGELFGAAVPITTVEISTAADNEGRLEVQDGGGNGVVVLSSDATSDGNVVLYNDKGVATIHLDGGDGVNAGLIQLSDAAGQTRIVLDASQGGKGRITCDVLEITGGADIVESFGTREGDIEPGTVVVIDAERPGDLRISSDPYDKRVAGIVSGAGGVDPGLSLGQAGVTSGDTQVALTGRVYVKACAENGPIRAGDRLTSASLAGHAMRVGDDELAVGAVLGKAMSELDAGTGLVLVLVNLQ